MTRLRPLRVARRHPVAVGVVAGVIAVQVIWMVEAACPPMKISDCLTAAIVLVGAASALALIVRAGWLAATTARALAALPPSTKTGVAGSRRTLCWKYTGTPSRVNQSSFIRRQRPGIDWNWPVLAGVVRRPITL